MKRQKSLTQKIIQTKKGMVMMTKEKFIGWIGETRKDVVVDMFLMILSFVTGVVLVCCAPVDDVFAIAAIIPGSIFLLCLWYYVNYLIASEFLKVAKQKGYSDGKYYWYCFLFGITGYLLVIALQNKNIIQSNTIDELPEI